MAFKGKTTANYNPKKGKTRQPAKTGGANPRNYSSANVLPGSKAKIVTKQSKAGSNPKNSSMAKISANRIQKTTKTGSGTKQVGVGNVAKVVGPAKRGLNPLNKSPFGGYAQLRNTKDVPAGKGNVRNSVGKKDVARLRDAGRLAMPKSALQGGKTFKSFIG